MEMYGTITANAFETSINLGSPHSLPTENTSRIVMSVTPRLDGYLWQAARETVESDNSITEVTTVVMQDLHVLLLSTEQRLQDGVRLSACVQVFDRHNRDVIANVQYAQFASNPLDMELTSAGALAPNYKLRVQHRGPPPPAVVVPWQVDGTLFQEICTFALAFWTQVEVTEALQEDTEGDSDEDDHD